MYDYSQMNYYPYNMYQNGGYGYQYPVVGKGLNNNLTLNTPQFDVNMYQNYGYRYQYPMHINTHQSNQLVSTPQQNLNVQNLPNIVNFKASEQIQAKSQKEGLSTGAKWAIGLGLTALASYGIYYALTKGRVKAPKPTPKPENPIPEIKEMAIDAFKRDGRFENGKAILKDKNSAYIIDYTGNITSTGKDGSKVVMEYVDGILQKSTKTATWQEDLL